MTKMKWHAYGQMDDESVQTLILGPTPREPADCLAQIGGEFDYRLGYLRSFDHWPTAAEQEELKRLMEGHA